MLEWIHFIEKWGSFKEHELKMKTWFGNSTGKPDEKSSKTGQNDKTKEKCWNMSGLKVTQEKMIIQI